LEIQDWGIGHDCTPLVQPQPFVTEPTTHPSVAFGDSSPQGGERLRKT
jgi:hypothetical protein